MLSAWWARWQTGWALLAIGPLRLLALGPAFGLLGGTFSWVIGSRLAMHPTPGDAFGQIVLHNVLVWTMWLALVSVIVVIGDIVRITRYEWRRAVAIHAVLAVVTTVFYCTAGGTLKYLQLTLAGQTTWGSLPMSWPAVVRSQFLFQFEWQFIVYWGLVGVSHALRFNRDMQARELGEARLEARLMEAQLEALQRQIHPHFLFNTLHAIGAVMRRDIEAADQMIDHLGVLLQALMRTDVRQTVRLAEELALTRQYLDIERVRFGARLAVQVDVAQSVLDARVPALLLQPLVENALRHGLAPRTEGGWIRITARRHDGLLRLQVVDNGVGLPPGAYRREGIGLANTRARLAQIAPDRHALRLDARPHGGAVVTIELPFRLGAAADAMVESPFAEAAVS